MLLLLYGCAYQGQTAPAVTVLPVEDDAEIDTGTDPGEADERQAKTTQ